jgi:AcrR family transcriptional regulator
MVHAATEAIGRRGLPQLRVADIADAAGVARGSVHYYFRDLTDLLQQVYKAAGDRFFAERVTAAAEIEDARDKLVASARRGLPDGPEDELAVVLYEFASAARGEPVYAALAQSLYDRQVAMYAGIFEVGRAQGHFALAEPLLDTAANMVALEDAYGLHIVARNPSLPPERALDLLLSFARAATGCAGLTPDRATGGTE